MDSWVQDGRGGKTKKIKKKVTGKSNKCMSQEQDLASSDLGPSFPPSIPLFSPLSLSLIPFFFFFFLAVPTANGTSWARDLTHITAVTRATAVTTLGP